MWEILGFVLACLCGLLGVIALLMGLAVMLAKWFDS